MNFRELARKVYELFAAEPALRGRLPPFEDLYGMARRAGAPSGGLRFGCGLKVWLRLKFDEAAEKEADTTNTEDNDMDGMGTFIAFLIIVALVFIGVKVFAKSGAQGAGTGTSHEGRQTVTGQTPPPEPAKPQTQTGTLLLAVKYASLEALGFGASPARDAIVHITDGRVLFDKTEYLRADATQAQIDALKEQASAEGGIWAFAALELDGAAMAKVLKNATRSEKRGAFDNFGEKQARFVCAAEKLPEGFYTKDPPVPPTAQAGASSGGN